MIFALIPAGGKSERMGRPKLLLPFRGKTILEAVISAFQSAKVERILVVGAPHLPELIRIANESGAVGVPLPTPTADMRATVEFGLQWAKTYWQPTQADAWFLAPADHPTMEAEVVSEIITARQRNPSCSVFIPTCEGRRGHPALIDWQHAIGIQRFQSGVGLNKYLREQGSQTLEVPVADSSILVDLDTPEDYENLQ